MTLQLIQQIQTAERELRPVTYDVVSSTPQHDTLREVGARLFRSTATRSLQLANRLDPQCACA